MMYMIKDELQIIGERIRVKREEKGYTLEEMSDMVDMEYEHLRHVEDPHCNSFLTDDMIKRLAAALDVDVDYFLAGLVE